MLWDVIFHFDGTISTFQYYIYNLHLNKCACASAARVRFPGKGKCVEVVEMKNRIPKQQHQQQNKQGVVRWCATDFALEIRIYVRLI